MRSLKSAGVFTVKNIYEEAGGKYTRKSNCVLTNLKIPPEKEIEIGFCGKRYQQYVKQH